MARPGRAPKPSGLRLVEGTDRRGRSGRTLDMSREPVVPEGELAPPYELTERVREIWDATVADLVAMKVAACTDAWPLAGYCEAAALFERASTELSGQELVQHGAESMVPNKLIQIRNQAQTTMLRFAQEFGLTPAARVRVEVAPGANAQSDANPFGG